MIEADWLEEFPPAWPELRADFLCNPYRVTVSPERYEGDMVAHYSIPQVQDTGGPLIEPADDIDSTKLLISRPTLLVSKLNPRKRTICIAAPQGDLVTLASGEFVPIQSDQFDQRYGYYVWLSEKVTDRLSAIVQSATRSHQRVNPADILKLPWKWPPLETQKRIAAFLDEKTAQIDALITRKQALLARLAEKRQAIITQAVTKGLNSAAPMKDSGIDWLGQMPAHWEIKKASWFFSVEKGKDAQKYTKEYCGSNPGDTPVFSGQTENEGILGHTDHHLYDVGDVGCLFSTTVGVKAMSLRHLKGKFCLSQNCMVIFPQAQICVPFYYYHLQAIFSFERGLIPSHMQPSFRVDDFYRFRIALPPSDEQVQISDWLEQQCLRISHVEAKAELSIYLLNEYRSALITSAVTGQIEGLR